MNYKTVIIFDIGYFNSCMFNGFTSKLGEKTYFKALKCIIKETYYNIKIINKTIRIK